MNELTLRTQLASEELFNDETMQIIKNCDLNERLLHVTLQYSLVAGIFGNLLCRIQCIVEGAAENAV